MSNLYNKKELKKQSRDFRSIASRTITSDFQMFNDNLKRLINYIDNNEIISKYIESCIDKDEKFNAEDEVNQVCGRYGVYFNNYTDEKKEVSYIYQILKFITDTNRDCRGYIMSYSASNKYQDKLKGFCDNVVEPLINHIDGNYERIFIEMGLDEETYFNVINNGGQVNIAKDNGNINAIQVNNSELDKLVQNVKENIETIESLEEKNEIMDNVEGIQEELKKTDIKKGRIRSFIASLRSKLPNIGNAIEVTAAITELINFAQGIIK